MFEFITNLFKQESLQSKAVRKYAGSQKTFEERQRQRQREREERGGAKLPVEDCEMWGD